MKPELDTPVFLGVCESALVRGDGVLQDFYGFGDFLFLAYYPQNLSGVFLLMGLSQHIVQEKTQLRIIVQNAKQPSQKAWRDLSTITTPAKRHIRINGYSKHHSTLKKENNKNDNINQEPPGLLMSQHLTYKTLPVQCPPLLVTEPTVINVSVEIEGQEFKIGSFECMFVPTSPISKEERLAIMSRPGAAKGYGMVFGCKKCDDKMSFYLSLDPESKRPEAFVDSVLLEIAPDKWICKCKKTEIPLTYIKKSFHEIFRTQSLIGKINLEAVPMYQKGAIAVILSEYQKVLNKNSSSEELIQKFLEKNPIMWTFLAPLRIWEKPPILTQYKADFAILTRMKILYFIEIEKPCTKLIKRNGGLHSNLQVGLDQIRNWKIEISKRREAVLHGIDLKQDDVKDIRYILIAGMANKTSKTGLEIIRTMREGADFIFCFDDLAAFLHSTETALLHV